MAELPPACAELRLLAAELALGTLEGSSRGESLAHVAGCAACRAHVQDLSESVDRLLAVAPEAEPPPGFESGVIARIAEEERGDEVGARRKPSRLLLAAAAAVLVLAGVVAGFLVAGGSAGDDGGLATTVMVSPGGESVGDVWLYGDEEAAVVVSVPAWADIEGSDGPRYALRLELDGDDDVVLGDFGLGDGTSSWGVTSEVDAGAIRAVSVIDDTGRVWCTGEFT